MADSLRISMIQSHIIWEDRDENLGYYGELLRRVSGKTDIAVLPETFTTGFSMEVEKLADTMDGPTVPDYKGDGPLNIIWLSPVVLLRKKTENILTVLSLSLRKGMNIIMINVIYSGWLLKISISRLAINVR